MSAASDRRAAELDRAMLALADPTRRAMIELLGRQPRRAGEIADALELLRPATSKHLRVLREAGLVEERAHEDARARMYALRPEPLGAVRGWLDDVEGFWSAQLDAFKAHVEKRPRSTSPPGRSSSTPPRRR